MKKTFELVLVLGAVAGILFSVIGGSALYYNYKQEVAENKALPVIPKLRGIETEYVVCINKYSGGDCQLYKSVSSLIVCITEWQNDFDMESSCYDILEMDSKRK